MNYFTKSELQIILLDMDTYIQINKILKESPSHRELRLKIQSMLDDYCEHDGEIGKDYPAEKCMKCGMMWE